MDFDANVDPRDQTLPPTREEIDDWAAREHRRRQAWLAGPGEEERHAWARRFRWRALLGWEESRLAPAHEDVAAWAEREHKRRQAWIDGPTEAEKRAWTSRRRPAGDEPESAAASAESVEQWAEREHRRRREWLDGPTEAEKQEWARRQTGSLVDDFMSIPARLEAELPESAQQLLRDAELAAKGAVYAFSRGPLALWAYLTRAGQTFERDLVRPRRRRRVPY